MGQKMEECNRCGRPYYVTEQGGRMPVTGESVDISCPHCGYTLTRSTKGLSRTSTLTPEREAEWKAEHGGT